MEPLKPTHLHTGRAALLATACLIVPLIAGETQATSSLAQRELARRSLAMNEAQELLRKGDESYQAEKYGEAVEAYAGALDLIPAALVTEELRASATERFAIASVEHARGLSRKGDLAQAKTVVDRVLVPSIAPDHLGALQFRSELDDPIRTNPALTAAHGANVDRVRRLLYTAEGAYNLGDFDGAKIHYQNVLRIDPFNSAARRGMEKVASAKSHHYQSAFDQTRAEMLSEVAANWELFVPAPEIDPALLETRTGPLNLDFIPVANKLDRIFIPSLRLEQASLAEAIDLLRVRAAEFDTLETDPVRKGVNITINLGPPDSAAATEINAMRFDLQLNDVPLSQVLRYVTEMTRTTFTTDDYAVVIKPLGAGSAELVTRTYRVPPDFISSLSASGAASPAASTSPFDEPAEGGGLLARQVSAQEALVGQSVPFPEGALANYNKNTGILMVVNTPDNHELISQIIAAIANTEPVMVAVRITIIRTEQQNLKELGYDWLLNDFSSSGGSLHLTGGTEGSGGSLADIPIGLGGSSQNPITAGNRSGDGAVGTDSIDSLIAQTTTGTRESAARAPGILGVNGTFDKLTFQGLMRGLDQKKGTDVMAQPAVITRSGQTTSIELVREFIFATEYEPPELPNSVGEDEFTGATSSPVTPAMPTAFEMEKVGLSLDVLPVADPDKRFIEVTLNPTLTDFDGFVNYGSPINTNSEVPGIGGGLVTRTTELTANRILMPVFSKQKATTSLTIADGATVVIGGMLRDSIENVEDKTPILGDLPIVGRLFQSKVYRPVSTAIIFLVNVELMDPTGRPFRDR